VGGTDRFTRDTAVEALADDRYRGRIDPGWSVIDGMAPNGGYVMALVARAMRTGLPHPDPISLTAYFLAPPAPGAVDIEVELLRASRRHSTVAATLWQSGRQLTRLLGTFGDLTRAEGPELVGLTPPRFPPVEDCVDVTAAAAERAASRRLPDFPIQQRFDHRVPAELTAWAIGQPTGRGEMGGYLRFADAEDGAAFDTLGLLVAADCLAPAVFNSTLGRTSWVPTIELTVQVRGRPVPGYLSACFRTRAITHGYLEEDGELWDAEGNLVALSRQMALAPR